MNKLGKILLILLVFIFGAGLGYLVCSNINNNQDSSEDIYVCDSYSGML